MRPIATLSRISTAPTIAPALTSTAGSARHATSRLTTHATNTAYAQATADASTIEAYAETGGFGNLGRLIKQQQTPVATVKMDVLGAPAFDDTLVYAALFDNSTAAHAIGSGNRQWRVGLDDRAISGPLVSGDLVLTPLANATVSSVSRSGTPLAATKAAAEASPETRSRDRLLAAAISPDRTQVFGVVVLETDARVLVCYRRPS